MSGFRIKQGFFYAIELPEAGGGVFHSAKMHFRKSCSSGQRRFPAFREIISGICLGREVK
jgi:hypothetical protein